MIEPIHPDRWVEQHAPLIYRTCRRHTSNEASAWEAFQETFLVYVRRKDSLDLQSDPGPWLRETARRCSLAVSRDQHRYQSLADSEVPEGWIEPTPDLSLSELTEILVEEISTLPQRDQQLLQFLYVEELTHRQVAARLDIPSGSVHARSAAVHEDLRQRMKNRDRALGLLLLLFLLPTSAQAGTPATSISAKATVGSKNRVTREVSPWAAAAVILTTTLSVFLIVDPQLVSHAAATVHAHVTGGDEASNSDSCAVILSPSEEEGETDAE